MIMPKFFSEIEKSNSELLKNSNEIIGNNNIDVNKLDLPIDSKYDKYTTHLENSSSECSDSSEKNSNGIEKMHTRNEELAGKKHPDTGVPFETRVVEDCNGNLVEVVVPKFESVFDARLPEELYKATDVEQFNECNKQLKEAIKNDPELAKKFTKEQLEQIENGDTPDGYTWHHDAETGKMQLVDSKVHAQTGHTGGKVIWGGGSENR